jgi:imidazolonepropionase-like amidohydrolase
MKKIILFSIVLQFFFSCNSSEVLFKNALCIENINTIDPIDGLRKHQTVILVDGKIFKIASSTDLKLSKENSIIDGTGKYLIPGLWDAHVHFAFNEVLAPSMFDLFLTSGITSVRDTGGEISFVNKWKQKSLANPTDSPRVMIAGPLLDGNHNVYDGSDSGHPPLSVRLTTNETIIKEIEKLDSLNVDLLKAYEMLTISQFKTIIKTAKEKGLKVTGHVPLSMDVISASNLGLNSMEHLRNLELSSASNADELLEQRKKLLKNEAGISGAKLRSQIHKAQRAIAIRNYDSKKVDTILKTLLKNNTWQIPTLTLNTVFTERYYVNSSWQESFNYIPSSIAKKWKARINIFKEIKIPEVRHLISKWNFSMVSKIHKAKIPIMAGTDCPIAFLTPGRSLHQELANFVKAGLSPLEAIKTATYSPAKYFNLEKELGSIKENMWADLVILDANPLENINNTTKIFAVIKQGNYLNRSKLDTKLEKLSKQ